MLLTWHSAVQLDLSANSTHRRSSLAGRCISMTNLSTKNISGHFYLTSSFLTNYYHHYPAEYYVTGKRGNFIVRIRAHFKHPLRFFIWITELELIKQWVRHHQLKSPICPPYMSTLYIYSICSLSSTGLHNDFYILSKF